jgi:hypothetical protein
MKAKLLFLTLALVLTAALQPSPSEAASGTIIQNSCLSLCARIRCIPEDTCGQYVNAQGQTVCGCHPWDTAGV